MNTPESLTRIDELKKQIDALRPLKPQDEQRIMEKFRLEWTYHSNAIEGNKLTLGETKAFLLEGLTAHGKPLKDHLDVQGHRELIGYLEAFIAHKDKLTEASIREMHRILLVQPYKAEATTPDGKKTEIWVKLGEYKTLPNCVVMGNGQIHQYVLPTETPAKMGELLAWHREQEANPTVHPLIHAALFHHRFTNIHPFDDGNGRLARILMNLIIMQAGYPPIVIKNSDRDRYVFALRRADAGESADLIDFLAEELIAAEDLYLRGARGENVEDVDDIDKQVQLLKQELRDIEEPLTLSRPGQEELFSKSFVPLVTRLLTKLAQFNDLFAEVEIRPALQVWTGHFAGGVGINAGEMSFTNAPDRMMAIGKNNLVHTLAFRVWWRGFKKAGLNAFDCTTEIAFVLEKFKYTIQSNKLSKPITHVYQHQLSEDETRSVVNELTKKVLNEIEANRKRK
jgi:Fic family protein